MTVSLDRPLAPGATIGILGGGQLGRMAALAAAQLGYKIHIFSPNDDDPALQVCNARTVAPYEDEAALEAFANSVDVVTFEFENVPSKTASFLAERVCVRPDPKVLHICQNRLREKDFLNSIDVPTTRYAEVSSADGVARALRDLGTPCVLKTAEGGYDGKGQRMIRNASEAATAWEEMVDAIGAGPGIMEAFVDFSLEISVIVARGADGQVTNYVPGENHHRNHILDQTIVPARVTLHIGDKAEAIARHIAEGMGLVGVMGVEMFVAGDTQVLVNELAPRPHNSGHWSIDACVTSQFENFVRAVTGLPLGAPERHSDATMKNLIGDEVNDWREILNDNAARLHIYGKSEARPGRKMGHVTRLTPRRWAL
jgi:5-(carboxyamino)imidazole ribonucleotide synthase